MNEAMADGTLHTQLAECRAMLADIRTRDRPDPEELARTWQHLLQAVELFRQHAPALDTGYGAYLCLLLVMWDQAASGPGDGAEAGVRRLVPHLLRPLLPDNPLVLQSDLPAPATTNGTNGRRGRVRAEQPSRPAH
ncbi:MAG: hypothetical protein ACYDEB_00890 [Dehalococcoidia bacterium]